MLDRSMTRRIDTHPAFAFNLPDGGPDLAMERALMARGHRLVAGADEAGRGPLAGPVVAAAVILDPDRVPVGIDDSKKLTGKRRLAAFDAILATARAAAIVSMPATVIDRIDIRKASLAAMAQAVHALALAPDAVLFDGRDVPDNLPALAESRAVVKGDARSLSIAAASILAKVSRDRMMEALGACHPHHGLAGHKGYGASAHLDAISRHGGIARIHRFSFRPLRQG